MEIKYEIYVHSVGALKFEENEIMRGPCCRNNIVDRRLEINFSHAQRTQKVSTENESPRPSKTRRRLSSCN